ncbi:MAG: bifunctional phosphoglucose/phosphomannose isomerase [Raineya sp.]|nr:bifunctional phosphoglucose/phosphomannose isomerase [Raineya sp.]MDW8296789.1 bifunctional phosphoglucose/phosphomannose isomerase [Raineya sp.]
MSAMQNLIEEFPSQIRKAVEIGKNIRVTPHNEEIQNIFIAGLGGSGIGGNLVESIVSPALQVPLLVGKNYEIPKFIGKNTLFIASSFSGSTEETLIALSQVKDAKIACISSGGKLIEIAQAKGFDYVQIPCEAPCPRAFLGYSFVQILYLLKGYGLLNYDFEADLLASAELLESKQVQIRQQAQSIAELCFAKIPFIYSDTRLQAVITRFQQQINENAKQLCHTHIFPEMNHNELVGWQLGKEHYQHTSVLLVKSSYDHPRTRLRMDICEPIFREKTSRLQVLQAQGTSFLEQALYLIHIFDWASLFLAEKNGVDAFPVDIITHLKNELAKEAWE